MSQEELTMLPVQLTPLLPRCGFLYCRPIVSNK